MITAGMDFAWQFANVNYAFFDNVTEVYMSHLNGRNLNIFYSTVDNYFQSVKKEQERLKFDWPVYTGDFFPYNGYHVAHYWTGYFTSRPNFKKLIRDFTGHTLASDTFFALEYMQKFKRNN